MTYNWENTRPPIIEEDDILRKQEMTKKALGLPPTTQEDVLEIARQILAKQEQTNDEK